MVRSFSSIAKYYIYSGRFFVDVLATIPYELIISTYSKEVLVIIRLLRIFRLKDTLKLLDISKLNKYAELLFSNNTRDQTVIISFLLVNIYRVFKLILTAILITYFLGCLWYFLSDKFNPEDEYPTFVKHFILYADDGVTPLNPTKYEKFITSCYFIITTLATIGYGDLYPKSNLEKIADMFIMICGVAFFSYIMGSFIAII